MIGATGLVGGYLLAHLIRRGERPYALSRTRQERTDADWLVGDLTKTRDADISRIRNALLHG